MKKSLFVILVSVVLAFLPFLWFKPGEVNFGGDSSRLYLYDPVNYLKNVALYNIAPGETGYENIPYFYIPFTLLLVVLKTIFPSAYLLNTIFTSFMIVTAFVFVYLSVIELLKGVKREIGIEEQVSGILSSFVYLFAPMVNHWDKALITHNQIFLNPLIFYLALRFIHTQKMFYALIALLITLLFAPNFSFASAPNFFAFYPLTLLFLLVYALWIRKIMLSWKRVAFVIILFVGIHSFHLIPQIMVVLDKGSSEYQRIFDSSESVSFQVDTGIKLSSNLMSMKLEAGITEIYMVIVPLTVILALFFSSREKKGDELLKKIFLLLTVFFLIALYFDTANITPFFAKIFELMFKVPGFSMFRNYYGQFLYVFYFFYSLLFAFALCTVFSVVSVSWRRVVSGVVAVLLVINGWSFINGDMVHLPILGTKNISVPFKMDPDFEETLQYIRTLPQDGKILTLPLADFGYQLIGGTEGGMYIGPSMIGYLTDKKDYSSYNGFGNQSELLLKYIKEKDYEALKNIFAVHNIRYVYFNEDPYVFDNFVAFPYDKTKEVLPSLDSYREFLRFLAVEEIFKKGSYNLYRIPEQSYSRVLYATNTILHTEHVEDIEYIFSFYSFAPSRLVVVPGKESEIVRAEKIDIYTRINKDYPFPVVYPFSKWKLNSPVYPLVIFKENNRLGCISGYIDPEIDCDLFYSLKRISELARWEGGIPVIGNVVNREDLLTWQDPALFNFSQWHTYNSWEAGLARYVSRIDKVVHFIESQNKGLVWEIEKKSEVTEILLENQRILNLIIKNSQKPEKDKVYVKQLLDEIFTYYLEKVKNTTYDPSRLEYVIPNTPENSGPYEILMENSSNNRIDPADMVLTIDGKEYKSLTNDTHGWINFGQIDLLNKESFATIKIPQADMVNDSLWQVGGTIYAIKNSDLIRLEMVSREYEGLFASIHNVTSPGHYLLSFDYMTHGDVVEARLFLLEKVETGNPNVIQLFQELKLSDVWSKMSAVVEMEKSSDIVVQIKPSEEARSIDVKNLSFVKLPHHPDIILRKIDTQRPSQIPDISLSQINPTKYKIDVRNVSDAYTLVFSQAFNKKWKLIDITKNDTSFLSNVERFLGGIGRVITRIFDINTAFMNEKTFETWGKRAIAQDSHIVANGYANGWLISQTDMDGADYTLALEITSQRVLYYYSVIVITALTASIVLVIAVQLARRFKNRRY